MRATMHHGRAGKNGAYRPGHNDRDFPLEHAEHIDPERAGRNRYHVLWVGAGDVRGFDEVEARFYNSHLWSALEARNRRYRKNHHPERVKTVDEYRKAPRSCPEETILQIGKKGETVEPWLLEKVVLEQVEWERKNFPNAVHLDLAIHADEEGAPHCHLRKVWVYHSKDGLDVGQEKALKEMGVGLPFPDRKEGRYNCRKMAYTQACRDHLLEVCKSYGLEIESEPAEPSKKSLTLLEYQNQQEKKKQEALEARKEELSEEVRKLEERKTDLEQSIEQGEEKFRERNLIRVAVLEARENRVEEQGDALWKQEQALRSWEKEVREKFSKALEEIRSKYREENERALESINRISRQYKGYRRLFEAIADSRLTYKGKPILEHFKGLAGLSDLDLGVVSSPVVKSPPIAQPILPKRPTISFVNEDEDEDEDSYEAEF